MQASDLYTICGAVVYLKFRPEGGTQWDGYQSKKIVLRNVKTQVGEPAIPSLYKLRSASSTSAHTPKKLKKQNITSPPVHRLRPASSRGRHTPKKLKNQNIVIPSVHSVPGKKSKSSEADNAKKTSSQKVTGKCSECGIIWESKADKELIKKYGKRQGSWIGCDRVKCKYWGHVKCAVLILTPRKHIRDHKFFCKRHVQ